MGTKTGIEWTDATWNPIRGCSRVSEGCRNCYAERQALRFSGAGQPYEGLAVLRNGHASWTGKIEFVEKHLLDPLKWKPIRNIDVVDGGALNRLATATLAVEMRPRRIFVNSMSDLFHENVTDEMLDKIFAVMALCPQHTFQVLTKRPERMLAYFTDLPRRADAIQVQITEIMLGEISDKMHARTIAALPNGWGGLPQPNVQLGVSVENQAAADERIPLLLKTPAAVRFISAEPLLGPVRLDRIADIPGERRDSLTGEWRSQGETAVYEAGSPHLDWVICGGESGPGARPMHPDWARSLRDQCQAAGVPFFFKQWGEWQPFGDTCGGPVAVSHDGMGHYSAAWSGDLETRKVGGMIYAGGDASGGVCVRVGKHAAGARLDGLEHKAFPEAR